MVLSLHGERILAVPRRPGRANTRDPALGPNWKTSAMAQANYEIHVSGVLPLDLLSQFGDLDVVVEPAETVLHGALRDQSSLFALIARIHSLGIQVIEIRRLTGSDDDPVIDSAPRRAPSPPGEYRADASSGSDEVPARAVEDSPSNAPSIEEGT
jgi:hypothetical protein